MEIKCKMYALNVRIVQHVNINRKNNSIRIGCILNVKTYQIHTKLSSIPCDLDLMNIVRLAEVRYA